MSKLERFSEVIASEISKRISMDQDKQEVLAYGAFIFIQTFLSIGLVVIFGIIFDVLFEALIISFAAASLRKFSGGAHATSPISCAIIGMIIFGVLAIWVKKYIISLNFLYLTLSMIVTFIFAYYIMYKYSPVGTVTKPLKNENTRKRLKAKSIKLIHYLFIANIFLVIAYLQTKQIELFTIAICISTGVLWQSITLVSLGHKIIDVMDKIIRGANNLIRRTNH